MSGRAQRYRGVDTRAQALIAAYERAGYSRAEPALLQPAEPFLDLSGEDIRSRMYLTTDADGRELCLRPDFTIAVSRDYLASPEAGKSAAYCYSGPIFRQLENGVGEVRQVGIESFGRRDAAAADAECLSLALEATTLFAIDAPIIRMGDVGLFAALVAAMNLPPAWKRRLVKDFNRKADLGRDLDQLTLGTVTDRPEYQGVLAALAGSNPKGAHALVTDLLSIAGITAVGGRSIGEIADRFLEQAALGGAAALPQDMRLLIERFLGIAGDPDECAAELRALAKDANIDIVAAIDMLESRTGFIAANGVKVASIAFATAFSNGLDYYTGFEFRLHDPRGRVAPPLAAGGRYDNLLTRLGSTVPIPAVGFGVFVERMCEAAS
ncbi:MAG TPA: ATP phosphoribosyltransferase regulatory subunit [Pseudorhodoplanes sp.]|nr:ATP phosphoribosyltransferase regulatory subunit [Pseudorhodoplanes sp.]